MSQAGDRRGAGGSRQRGVGEVSVAEPVLRVSHLDVGTRNTPLVKDVDLTIRRGERVGLIGESGSGKTLTALAIMGLLPDGVQATGDVRLAGTERELLGAGERALSSVRGLAMAMVFQEPMTALNPTMRVGAQVAEVMTIHRTRPSDAMARRAAVSLLDQVGLPDPERIVRAYPHQLSGGQRQRVVLAIALANDPALLICDEPTTALDVTVQEQVLDLIVSGVEARDSALLFITHDLAVVASVCERVLVMYGGRIVEAGPVRDVLTAPRHPYTQGLLSASDLERTDEQGRLVTIAGAVPPAGQFPAGCVFRNRCPRATEICETLPPWAAAAPDRGWACYHPLDGAPPDPGASDRIEPGSTLGVDTAVAGVPSEGDPRGSTLGVGDAAADGSSDPGEPGSTASDGGAAIHGPSDSDPQGSTRGVGGAAEPADPGEVSAVDESHSGVVRGPLGRHAVAAAVRGGTPSRGPLARGGVAAPIVSVRELRRTYRRPRSSLLHAAPVVEALRGVSFEVMPGERFGIVGESGSGKSTLLRLLAGLEQPTSGEVNVLGRSLSGLGERRLGFLRNELQLVFQDPMSSLDPRMRVRDIVAEPLVAQRRMDAARVAEVLAAVGMSPDAADRYPHQFSGGQRQRISIARALSPNPSILVADEPVSALDVSLRAQVLNLISDLVDRLSLTLIFVSHDLAVVRHLCERVAVMHAGEIVELDETERVYNDPQHPYTQQLVAAVPSLRRALAEAQPTA